MKILIVDDYQFNRELLIYMMSDQGYEHCIATNGREAVEKFSKDRDIDLILMDINMPVMDGIEATKNIKKIALDEDRFVPVIFVTSLDNDETLARCLEMGGEDFIPKPINEIVLSAKLIAHQRTVNYHKQLRKNNETLSYHRRIMEREHSIVEKIFNNGQQRLERNCNNIKFRSIPASMFNGDLLLVATNPLGGVYVLLGDFTGHGLSAAIGCMPVTDIFYAMVKKKTGISAIAREINNKLQDILPDNMFFCAAILELDKNGDRLTVWSGGMNDILFLNDTGKIIHRVAAQHMPLGILSAAEFDNEISIFTPISGLRVYVYSDGIVEAQNREKEFYGEQRFEALLQNSTGPCIETICSEIEQFQDGSPPSDDITVVEILCQPVDFEQVDDREKNQLSLSEESFAVGVDDMALPWNMELNLTPENLRNGDVIDQIVSLISSVENARGHRDIIFTVVSELFNNALEHGLLNLDSSMKNRMEGFSDYYHMRKQRLEKLVEGVIKLKIKVIPGTQNRIVFSITDSGDGFDPNAIPNVDIEHDLSHARGTRLINSLCEELSYSNGGRTATITYVLN